MNVTLTIAGFDTSSGAGASADLMVFAAHGLYGTACLTALTVQSTMGVQHSEPVSGELVRDTLACLASDTPPKGIKIGMLATAPVVRAVADFLRDLPGRASIPIVLDPVLQSSSGHPLLDDEGREELAELLNLVSWVTPNTVELASITAQEIPKKSGIPFAVQALQAIYPQLNIVATGGHLDTADDFLRTSEGSEHWFSAEKIKSRATHGTGCAFSSALLSRLVLGDDPVEAVAAAKAYVIEAIRSAPIGIGQGNGPLNHLWPLKQT